MPHHIEPVHLPERDPSLNMPFVPAIRVNSGKLLFVAGATAAPLYHQHPHIPEDFEHIPDDPAQQAELAMDRVERVLEAAGGGLHDVVSVTRFIPDIASNQDAINRVMNRRFGDHRPTSTTVEVTRLAADARLKIEITAIAVVSE